MVALFSGCTEKEGNDTKLQAPSSLRVSSDNVLTWSVVKGAVAYLPNINDVDYETVTSNQFFLSDAADAGHLVIKVKAIGDGTTCLDSDWSEELEYDMIIPLHAPVPVVSGKTVSWEAVDGANKYEYTINGSLVRTDATTIDLSGFPSDKYSITVRALPADSKQNTVSAWSSEVMLAIVDRLSTPVLTVVQPSLKTPDAGASVTWEPVEFASGYDVYINDVKHECEGTSLDVSHMSGTFQVKVTAVNPGEYDSSETAIATITIKVYGKGTETDPYKIYDATDWNDFVDMVSTNEGISGYLNKYLQLQGDIDFENAFVKPAGVSSLLSFKGTLDGNGHTLKNAKIGDGTGSHQAFFHMLNGTVKNLDFDNITVKAGDSSSAAVISAGDSDAAFTIENCHVNSSTVIGGGANVAGLVAKCNHSSVIIDCSVSNSTITAGKEGVGAIAGSLINGTLTNVTATQNVLSGKSNVGGIVGTLGEATLLNVISTNNSLTVTTSSCGGVAGVCSADNGNIINVLSNANTVCCLTQSNAPYLGLIMGGHKDKNKNKVCNIKNTLILSGTASYVFDPAASTKKFAGGIGVAIGYGNKCDIESSYYSENSRYLYDNAFYEAKGTTASTSDGLRLAIGAIVDTKAGDDKEFSAKSETELTDGTVLNLLNAWVNENKTTYPELKSWSVDDNKFPKLQTTK